MFRFIFSFLFIFLGLEFLLCSVLTSWLSSWEKACGSHGFRARDILHLCFLFGFRHSTSCYWKVIFIKLWLDSRLNITTFKSDWKSTKVAAIFDLWIIFRWYICVVVSFLRLSWGVLIFISLKLFITWMHYYIQLLIYLFLFCIANIIKLFFTIVLLYYCNKVCYMGAIIMSSKI